MCLYVHVHLFVCRENFHSPIAIVGIGCRTPGADNIWDYWRLLKNGENHVIDVPIDRWNASAFLHPDPTVPGKAYNQKGGFMKE